MTLPTPKHYRDFNEAGGLVASDAIGGAKLALNSASWVPGRMDSAIRFATKPEDGVTLATTNLPELPPPWTAGFWVKRTADSESTSLFSSNDYALKLKQYNNTNQLGITRFSKPDKLGSDGAYGYTAPLETWVHLALVGTATETTLYVDGKRQGSTHEPINLGLYWLGSTQGIHDPRGAVSSPAPP